MDAARRRLQDSVLNTRPDVERLGKFFRRVRVSAHGCWVFVGARHGRDYSNFSGLGAHVVSYRWFVGPIPEKHHIHHTCQTPQCVNPVHLEAVSPKEHGRLHARIRRYVQRHMRAEASHV
jgi:hypothetical protein